MRQILVALAVVAVALSPTGITHEEASAQTGGTEIPSILDDGCKVSGAGPSLQNGKIIGVGEFGGCNQNQLVISVEVCLELVKAPVSCANSSQNGARNSGPATTAISCVPGVWSTMVTGFAAPTGGTDKRHFGDIDLLDSDEVKQIGRWLGEAIGGKGGTGTPLDKVISDLVRSQTPSYTVILRC